LLAQRATLSPSVRHQDSVATSQVAPTILDALNFDPEALRSVRQEHTSVLPGIGR
jgi:hypothetical protein